MVEESRIFHESWYRIANQHVSLSAGVKVHRQLFRGSRWYVLCDPFSGQFFRLRPAAYEFVARLSMKRTVEEVWEESMSRDAEDAPGQEDVIQLLAQLYHANLLHFELPPDSEKLFERYTKQKQKVTRSTLMNIMFARIPLIDPDNTLKRFLPFVRLLMNPFGVVLWVAVVTWAIIEVVGKAALLGEQTQGVLALGNIPLLYAGLVLIKCLHELGHAFAVRRFGGEVHTLGVMFLIFSPLPYVDATAAWAFREKWKRVLVGGSGMIVEIFFAACAAIIWANTGTGVVHSLAYNLIFVASVSTIVFNVNPLLRYDGYYMLSDLLDIPNLHAQATMHLRHLVERYGFGMKQSRSPSASRAEGFWLSVFGVLSGIYRVVVFGGILLLLADRFLLAGIVMAVVCAISWLLTPALRLIHYLAADPKLQKTRARAVGVCVGAVVTVAAFLYFCPFPNSFKSPGVVKARESQLVVTRAAGAIAQVVMNSGARVRPGDALVRMESRELDLRIQELEAKLAQVLAERQRALQGNVADVKTVDGIMMSIQLQLEQMMEERGSLTLTASVPGIWVAPYLSESLGMWMPRGAQIGQVVNDASFYFSAVVSQRDVSRVFSGEIRATEVRISGQAGTTVHPPRLQQIPMEQTALPSAALGLGAGGDVSLSAADTTGIKAAQTFYEVRLDLPHEAPVALSQGQSGRALFRLPSESLLKQAWRKLRQLLQERYKL